MRRIKLILVLVLTSIILGACGGKSENSYEDSDIEVAELSDKEAKKLAKDNLKRQKEAAKLAEKEAKAAEKAEKKAQKEEGSEEESNETEADEESADILRIPKNKLSLMTQGFDGVYANTPITLYAWKDRKGEWQVSLDVDKKIKEKLPLEFDTSASSKVEPYYLKFKEESDYLAIDLSQLKKQIKAYAKVISG